MNNFTHFGEQKVVDFILEVEPKVPVDELYNYLNTIVDGVHFMVQQQLDGILNVLYPATLSDLKYKRSKLNQELHAHLQQNYKTLFTLEKYIPQDQLQDVFVSEQWRKVPGFGKAVLGFIRALYDLLVQIKLTPNLSFATLREYDSQYFKSPFQDTVHPRAVLPPLMVGERVIAQGYAY